MMYYNETPTPNNRILSMIPSSSQSNGGYRPPPNPLHPGFAIGRFATLNPWDLRRYQEQQIQNEIQMNQVQQQFNRDLYASALAYTGHSPNEFDISIIVPDFVPQYSDYEDYRRQQEQRIQDSKINEAVNSPQIYSSVLMEMKANYFEQTQRNMDRYEGMTKEEMYRELDKIALESIEWEQERARRNFGNRYSKSEFRKYLNSSTSSTTWKTISTIDDLEVQLPTGISSDYNQRRAKFLQRLGEMRAKR